MKKLVRLLFFGLMTFSYSQAQADNLFDLFRITDAATGQEGLQPSAYPDPQFLDNSVGSEAQMIGTGGDSLTDQLPDGSGFAPYSTATGNGRVSH